MLICKISFRFIKNEDRIPKCIQIGQTHPPPLWEEWNYNFVLIFCPNIYVDKLRKSYKNDFLSFLICEHLNKKLPCLPKLVHDVSPVKREDTWRQSQPPFYCWGAPTWYPWGSSRYPGAGRAGSPPAERILSCTLSRTWSPGRTPRCAPTSREEAGWVHLSLYNPGRVPLPPLNALHLAQSQQFFGLVN